MASWKIRIRTILAAVLLFSAFTTLSRPALAQSALNQPAAKDKRNVAVNGGAPAIRDKQPLSTRIVAYQIQATLHTREHKIKASETLIYRNLTGRPQQTFPFHLYLNAFQPPSTFMTEARLYGLGGAESESAWDPKHFGSITVTKLEIEDIGDLTGKMQFIQPDDRNTQDHTVFQISLPKAVEPNASVVFHMDFEDLLPEVVARTGYKRDFFMVGQWFPKIGVWWKNQWNCHQFHANTEFFADFGTFDVKLTLPQNEIVGAGGDLVASRNNPDGTKTVTFHSEDVHDFSWTASPNFTDVEDSWTGSSGTVRIHMLMSPGHMRSALRYMQALKGTLSLYDQWVGPYPYDRITVVNPPHGALDAGGMEYPTLVTAGTAWFLPKGILLPEGVVEHEFGHQYWYGMVATNEFEEAWLDEGINSYMEMKVMDALYGTETSSVNFPFAQEGEPQDQRGTYLHAATYDPLTRFAWQFIDSASYYGVTYGKTATVLLTLEKLIGEDKMREALHQYFLRYRFTHPTGEDFLKTIEDVSGQNLRWYFDQAVYGTNILDYEIQDVHSERAKPYETSANKNYRTYVTVRRRGDFIFPVNVKISFDDKTSVMEHWDGRDRWIRYAYDRPAQVVSAEVDPYRKVWLDRNFFNNSRTIYGDDRAAHKLLNISVFLNEWISQLFAWIT